MKLCFWMLGEDEWSIEQIAQNAARWGYHGVDLRVARRDGQPQHGGFELTLDFSDAEIALITEAFAAFGLEVSSLMCQMAAPGSGDPESWPKFEQEFAEHARLAQRVGSPRIMISPDQPSPEIAWGDYLDKFWSSVRNALAETPAITSVVIQNHIGRANAAEVLASAERSGDPRFGCEFSCDHVLVMQEDTFALIDRYASQIHKICYADRSVPRDEAFGSYDGEYFHVRFRVARYGEGIVQSERMFSELLARGFDGYVGYKCEASSLPGAVLSASEELMTGFPRWMRGFGFPVVER